MLLYQIIVDNEDKLILFDHEIHNPGFIGQIASQITEMQAGNVLPEDLLEMLENSDSTITNDLRDKLHDFAIIYSQYVKQISDNYFDNHTVLNLLSENWRTLTCPATTSTLPNFQNLPLKNVV